MNSSIGFFTGYYYTTVFAAKDDLIVEYTYLRNRDFFKAIANQLDGLIKRNFEDEKISFIFIYTGVAPLSTLRAVCAWVQGWRRASGIPVVAINDTKYMRSNKEVSLVVNMFGGKFAIIESDELIYMTDREAFYNGLMQRLGRFECVYSVSIPDCFINRLDVSFVITPDLKSFAEDSFNKYSNKRLSTIEGIVPNFEKAIKLL